MALGGEKEEDFVNNLPHPPVGESKSIPLTPFPSTGPGQALYEREKDILSRLIGIISRAFKRGEGGRHNSPSYPSLQRRDGNTARAYKRGESPYFFFIPFP